MKEKAFAQDLDLIHTDLEAVQDAIICFNEFIDEEGYIPDGTDLEEAKQKAYIFCQRLSTYQAILTVALNSMSSTLSELSGIVDEMLKK